MDLTALGWSPGWETAFAAFAGKGWLPGRVALEDKHAYVVVTREGEGAAVVPGRMLQRSFDRSRLPKVGDWVALRPLPEGGKGVIEAVMPRQTQLARKVAGRRVQEQVMVANVDLAFVVMALDPSYNLRRMERFLVMVREGGVLPVIVLNKADLAGDVAEREAEVRQVVRGARVVVASARTGQGVSELDALFEPGRTVAFIGTSGVGKSSLINRLYGQEIQATLEVRETDSKGRHSTTWRELIVLPRGGVVVDTPGMREFHMWMAQEGLEDAFPDIEALAVHCHFRSCTHTVEKRCSVRQAIEEGRLARARFQSYVKLKGELEYLAKERREHTFQRRRTRKPSKQRHWTDNEGEGNESG